MRHIAPLLALLGATAASPLSADRTAALLDCLTAAGVPVDEVGSAEYKLDATGFNLALNYTPAAVAAVTTAEHIRDAVTCARELGFKATPKCGGHSYANFGLGGEDGHLVIEMSRFNKVVLDPETGIATAQGGTRLGHFAWEVYNQGKRAISHGTCPGVGAGGHVLHGGFGMSSHTRGLASDWLVGATVLLANSTFVNCSETENPDLFWALRGAGGSMGVVTEFRFKTFEVPETVTFFVASVQWPTEERAFAGLKAAQEFADTMAPELNMRLFIAKRFVNFEGLYHGNRAGLQEALAPLLKATGAVLAMAREGNWVDQARHFGGMTNIDQQHGHEDHDTFFSTSLYTKALSDDKLQTFVSYWFRQAKASPRDWYVQIDFHGGKTSAVSKPDRDYTAYAYRDALFLFLLYDRVDDGHAFPADGHELMSDLVNNITHGLSRDDWGMYINYPNHRLSQDEAQVNYWGRHLPKLQAIKKAVDPEDLFHFPQGVLPA